MRGSIPLRLASLLLAVSCAGSGDTGEPAAACDTATTSPPICTPACTLGWTACEFGYHATCVAGKFESYCTRWSPFEPCPRGLCANEESCAP